MLVCDIVKLTKPFPSNYFGKLDLFVEISCGKKAYRTVTIWNEADPVWNSRFIFDENISYNEIDIEVTLCDEDSWSKNEKLREGKITTKKGIFFGDCCGVILHCYTVEIYTPAQIKITKDTISNLQEEIKLVRGENEGLIEENADLKERASYIKRELGFFVNALK